MTTGVALMIFTVSVLLYVFVIINKVHALMFLQFNDNPYSGYFKLLKEKFSTTKKFIAGFLITNNKDEWPVIKESKVKKLIDLADSVLAVLKPFIVASIFIIIISTLIEFKIAYDPLKVSLGEIAKYLTFINFYGLGKIKDFFPLIWAFFVVSIIVLGQLKYKPSSLEKVKKNSVFILTFLTYFSGVSFFGAATGQKISKEYSELKDLEFQIITVHDSIFNKAKDIAINELRYELAENISQEVCDTIENSLNEIKSVISDYDKRFQADIKKIFLDKRYEERVFNPEGIDLFKDYLVNEDSSKDTIGDLSSQDALLPYYKPYIYLYEDFERTYDYKKSFEYFKKADKKASKPRSDFFDDLGEINWTDDYLKNKQNWNKTDAEKYWKRLDAVEKEQKVKIVGLNKNQKEIYDNISKDFIAMAFSKGTGFLKDLLPASYKLSIELLIEPFIAFVATGEMKMVLDKILSLEAKNNKKYVNAKPKIKINLKRIIEDKANFLSKFKTIKVATAKKIKSGRLVFIKKIEQYNKDIAESKRKYNEKKAEDARQSELARKREEVASQKELKRQYIIAKEEFDQKLEELKRRKDFEELDYSNFEIARQCNKSLNEIEKLNSVSLERKLIVLKEINNGLNFLLNSGVGGICSKCGLPLKFPVCLARA
ncbi:hypothetical protein R9C00_18030 [Flammeovirgaceae bacterium SG7u.111]|nr:hypothetical protein [Flammeovirgaceae bacterium SG7u.132]WPO33604.1 hypothetical protein R9C00_18030 [Flammeovirgaceae bacterium SG7u.111]